MIDIIKEIKKAGLVGRGGANYPVWQKWQAVFDSAINDTTSENSIDVEAGKYVICNCSEGEPGVKKDAYLIEKHAEKIIDGMKIAANYINAKQGVFYLNENYYKKYGKLLEKSIIKLGAKIELFKKPHTAGYIGGEETTLLNIIEGKHAEPRLKPPYPVTSGLWGQPTIINNVETFYDVSRVVAGAYEPTRAYTIVGDCLFDGVYELPIDMTIQSILQATHNFPKFDFFVQIGGDGSGEILNQRQLNQIAGGAGTIHIYSTLKHQPFELIKNWAKFFMTESCGKCTPCREGTYRLVELLNEATVDWQRIRLILNNLSDSSFCALGMSVPISIRSYVKNVIDKDKDNLLKIYPADKEQICKLLI